VSDLVDLGRRVGVDLCGAPLGAVAVARGRRAADGLVPDVDEARGAAVVVEVAVPEVDAGIDVADQHALAVVAGERRADAAQHADAHRGDAGVELGFGHDRAVDAGDLGQGLDLGDDAGRDRRGHHAGKDGAHVDAECLELGARYVAVDEHVERAARGDRHPLLDHRLDRGTLGESGERDARSGVELAGFRRGEGGHEGEGEHDRDREGAEHSGTSERCAAGAGASSL
jgi:hypothetical protein